jgi:hypothetical protein
MSNSQNRSISRRVLIPAGVKAIEAFHDENERAVAWDYSVTLMGQEIGHTINGRFNSIKEALRAGNNCLKEFCRQKRAEVGS